MALDFCYSSPYCQGMAGKQALAYLRVSGLGQVDGDGFERQSQAVTAYAKHAGLTIVETYRDEGISGKKDLEHRPRLAALLDRVQTNGVRIVLVERADRIARDLLISETILGQLRTRGVKVFDSEGVELTAADGDATRKLIRQVLGAVAEFDRDVTVQKLRAARERVRARDGRCEGRRPYGSTSAEKIVLERVRSLRRYGSPIKGRKLSFAKIAATLNSERVPTRTGSSWQPSTVYGVLEGNELRFKLRRAARLTPIA
jgi:DNA invertase Pin-like site-specific DNA recombinase